MPVVVALGLVALAVANAVLAFREPESAREALDPKPAILIGGGLAVLITLLTVGGGFIPEPQSCSRQPRPLSAGGLSWPTSRSAWRSLSRPMFCSPSYFPCLFQSARSSGLSENPLCSTP
jgi:hypothetical protein